jgi:hypothetical protein
MTQQATTAVIAILAKLLGQLNFDNGTADGAGQVNAGLVAVS